METSPKKLLLIGGALLLLLLIIIIPSRAASYFIRKGQADLKNNNYAAAKADFGRALIFSRKNPVPHAYLGKIALGKPDPYGTKYYPDADWSGAIAHYEEALALHIKEADRNLYLTALEDAGFSYWNLKQFDAARKKYQEKFNESPSSFWPRYFLALDDFNRMNKAEEGFAILRPAITFAASKNNKDNLFHVYTLLGRFSAYSGDYAAARSYANLAIANVPESFANAPDIQAAHAILAVVSGKEKNFAVAEKEITTANSLAGKSVYNCTLSRAYMLGKNYKKAAEVAQKSADKATGDYGHSICLINLAQARLALGEKTEAKRYFEEYLALTDGFEQKNIFTMRDRGIVQKELAKLSGKTQ